MNDQSVVGEKPRDPEVQAHEREMATRGVFKVVVISEEHGELGTLNKVFDTDVAAGWAAHEATISDVGIRGEVKEIENESPPQGLNLRE